LEWLKSVPMAHRGLHDRQSGIMENSVSAFGAALEAGYGIECDVQVSSDGQPMVFHDTRFDRLTQASGRLRERTAKEISKLTLTGSQDRIQTLGELLEQVGGRSPVLVEIKKTELNPGPLEAQTKVLLDTYKGPIAIMSFNPKTVAWFGENAPNTTRGQLSEGFYKGPNTKRPALQRFAARHLFMNVMSKPDFVGYNIQHLPMLGPSLVRKLGTPILAWTVKTPDHIETAKRCADNIIFEGFKPALDWAQSE
jgi:glycerophosphoryl diester phosphodiesterase